MKNFLISRLKSFGYAITGIRTLVTSERNAWIHLFVTIAVIIAGLLRHLDKTSWCLLILAIALVWITEALNTAIEKIGDKIAPEYNPIIKQVKDISAGAVLIAALAAVAIGVFVFF